MNKLSVFALCAASAALLSAAAGCIASKPPVAISKSTYTGLEKSEQQLMPEGIKLLTLDEAQQIAIQNNPSFKSAYFAIAAARARYYQSFSSYLPTISTSLTIGQGYAESLNRGYGNSSQTTTVSPGLQADWLVFDSFVREMNVLAARHNWKQSEAAEQDARRILLRSVAYAYNNVMLSATTIKIAEADMEYNERLLKETELKFQTGASPLSDVLNFKVQYNMAESSLYTSQYSYAQSKYALAELLGLTIGTIPDEIQFPEMPSPDGEILADISVYLDEALANRPDLKSYREALEAAKYSYYASIAAFGPSFYLSSGMSYNNNKTNIRGRYGARNSDSRQTYYNFNYSGTVSWELFSGGSTYFSMRAAQAAVTQADYDLASAWIAVIADVRTAYDNYITNLKQVKLNQKNLEIVRKTRDLVDQEYRAGSTGITRVNEAQRDLVDAETSLANAVINMHNAKAQLDAATNSI